MQNDQILPDRRALLRITACVAAATLVPLFSSEGHAGPEGAGPDGAGAPPPPAAAGPTPAEVAKRPSAYRLRPVTGHTPARAARPATPVRRRPLLQLPSLGRSMVLSFDDGPDPRYTPDILKTLRKHGVRAMFFVCGEMAVHHRDLLREMADGGHVVGNHSWSHPLITKLRPSRIRDELGRTSDLIEKTLGAPPLWYRAPYGAWNKLSFEIGAELGMEPLAWTIDTLDWRRPGSAVIVRRVLDGREPGAVVLSHDAGGDRSQSVAALRRYLPALLDSGFRITVPVR